MDGIEQASAREKERKGMRGRERETCHQGCRLKRNALAFGNKCVLTLRYPLVISDTHASPIVTEPAYLITAAIDTVVCRAGNYGRMLLLPSAAACLRQAEKRVQPALKQSRTNASRMEMIFTTQRDAHFYANMQFSRCN